MIASLTATAAALAVGLPICALGELPRGDGSSLHRPAHIIH